VAVQAQQSQVVTRLAYLQGAAAHEVMVLQQRQAESAAQARENAAVLATQQLAATRSSLQAQIQKLLAELASHSTSWSQVLRDIHTLAQQYGIDPLLVEAIVLQESGGNAHIRSSAGAIGLMQLMPGTAAALGVTNALDPIQNLRGGITYLLEMLHEFHGNLRLALAAYNAGPYAVKAYGGIPPYQQTQQYVRDVLAIYHRVK